MSNVNSLKMKEQEENKEQELNELEKWAAKHITVAREPFYIDDNCPFLVRKLEQARKTLEEAPIPEWLIKRMKEKD